MSQLLIKLKDHTNTDPVIDRQGAYKRNMVIAVVDDSHVWGKMESKAAWIAAGNSAESWHGKTGIIELKGKSNSAIADLQDHLYLAGPIERVVDCRRKWEIAIDSLPVPLQRKLHADGVISVAAASLNGLVRKIGNPATKHREF